MNDLNGLEARALRNALGCFATGVTVITSTSQAGEPIGITMNSFSSVSLDPPMILFSIDRGSEYLNDFMAAENFAVNVLSESQENLSNRFASKGRDPLAAGEFDSWLTGCPILKGALVNLECTIKQRVEGGDHIIFLCNVVKADYAGDGAPLLFHRGAYARLTPA